MRDDKDRIHIDQLAKWCGYHGMIPPSGEVVEEFAKAMGENQYGVEETWDAFCWFRNGFNSAGAKVASNTRTAAPYRLPQSCVDAQEACVDIYNDFDNSEIEKETRSFKNAWLVGRSILDARASTLPSAVADGGALAIHAEIAATILEDQGFPASAKNLRDESAAVTPAGFSFKVDADAVWLIAQGDGCTGMVNLQTVVGPPSGPTWRAFFAACKTAISLRPTVTERKDG